MSKIFTTEIEPPLKVTVIGGGAFGTSIAILAARNNHYVEILVRDVKVIEDINVNHQNSKYLHDYILPNNIIASNNVQEVTGDADIIFLAIPAQQLPRWLEENRENIPTEILLCNTAKGLYAKDECLLSEAVKNALGRVQPYAVLSGPSFANEMIRNNPTAVVVASRFLYHAVYVSNILSSPHFRCYTSQDVLGVELCGALKNPLAIGAGIIDGLGLGMNTKSAFITLAAAELKRLCTAMGGEAATIDGLAGIGDLILTSFGELSRNHSAGVRLSHGHTVESIIACMTVEGVQTSTVAIRYADMCSLELPIFRAVAEIVHGRVALKDAALHLLGKHTSRG